MVWYFWCSSRTSCPISSSWSRRTSPCPIHRYLGRNHKGWFWHGEIYALNCFLRYITYVQNLFSEPAHPGRWKAKWPLVNLRMRTIFWIRNGVNADPDPAFSVNADLDPRGQRKYGISPGIDSQASIPSLAGQYDNPIWCTGPPGYTGWRNWFLEIDSWAP